jgi:hypothetical protein
MHPRALHSQECFLPPLEFTTLDDEILGRVNDAAWVPLIFAAPYRGAAPIIQDLVAGQIDLAITDPVVTLPQVRAGTIKAYGVTTKTRLVSAPDIPTLDEAGCKRTLGNPRQSAAPQGPQQGLGSVRFRAQERVDKASMTAVFRKGRWHIRPPAPESLPPIETCGRGDQVFLFCGGRLS